MDGAVRTQTLTLTPEPDLDWAVVGVADFDGDGKPDVLWQNEMKGAGRVWFLDGLTLVGAYTFPSEEAQSRWQPLATADFNGDGTLTSSGVTRRRGTTASVHGDGAALSAAGRSSLYSPGSTIAGALMSGVPNDPPVADAGGSYRWTAGQPIRFDGTRSTDEDGEIVGYSWSFGDGTTGTARRPATSTRRRGATRRPSP
jgi:hypothetical protein